MIQDLLRFFVRNFSNDDFQLFMERIWEPLERQDVSSGQRYILLEAEHNALIRIIRMFPFLKYDEVSQRVTFCEFEPADLPDVSCEVSKEALKSIAEGVTDIQELGELFAPRSEREDSWERRGSGIIHDLQLLNLVTPQRKISHYGGEYLRTEETWWLRQGIFLHPLFRLYYDILVRVDGFIETNSCKDLLLSITRLIIVNPSRPSLITESVATKRLNALLSWFKAAEIVDQNLKLVDHEECLLYVKETDHSLFEDGLAIPIAFQKLFFQINGERLARGESQKGAFLIEEREYEIHFRNSKSTKKSETIQIRYDGNGSLKDALKRIFHHSFNYIQENKIDRKPIKIPEDSKEYIQIFSTFRPYFYRIEVITVAEKEQYHKFVEVEQEKGSDLEKISNMSEEEFAEYMATFKNDQASYEMRQGLKHYRKICGTLVRDLKKRYNNCCQICGYSFKDEYGVDYSEAHHIKPFAKYEDHRPENIIILCPNHHRIVHKAKPEFDQEKKQFVYQNGRVEELKLNEHI